MINIDTVEQEILTLESKDTSYAVVERLAWLYIVRDHLRSAEVDESTGDLIGSEFCEACSNVPINSLMQVLTEHMEAIRLLYPREYDNLIHKIKSLKS